MGRSLAGVLVVVALVAGVAFLDEDRERGSEDVVLSPPAQYADPSATDDPLDTSLDPGSPSSCLDVAGTDLPEESDFPGLDPQGVEEIADRVERLRELRFDGPVDASFLTDEQLDARIGDLTGGKQAKKLLEQQGTALELLGAIPDGSDLFDLSSQTLEDQVVGLYVPDEKELLVASSGKPGAVEQITLAHELEHALADADLGLPAASTASIDSDEGLAAQALVEGDATLTMQLYALRYVSLEDQLALGDDPAVASDGLDEIPDFLRRQLLFPYEAGLIYVCDRYEEGGWEAVDEAYADPPETTAELLGLRDEPPVTPPEAGSLPAPWEAVERDQLGAAALAWLFAAPGGDPEAAIPDPSEAIGGWAGDRVVLWQRGGGGAENSALSLSIADEGGTLCGAMIAWYAAANPDAELGRDGSTTTFEAEGKAAAIGCGDGSVLLAIAPDAATVATLTS